MTLLWPVSFLHWNQYHADLGWNNVEIIMRLCLESLYLFLHHFPSVCLGFVEVFQGLPLSSIAGRALPCKNIIDARGSSTVTTQPSIELMVFKQSLSKPALENVLKMQRNKKQNMIYIFICKLNALQLRAGQVCPWRLEFGLQATWAIHLVPRECTSSETHI